MHDDHDSLDSVIGRYLELAESGRAPDRTAFLNQNPRHREGLLSFFADYHAMHAAVGAGGGRGEGAAGGVPAVTADATGEDAPHDLPANDRYTIVGEIARGGMGAVLRAVDLRFGRPVALKVLREDRDDELLRRRFLFEAQVTGSLQHPGIPPVHDQGRLPDGRLYLAMKLIEGRTLSDLLDERKTPADGLSHYLGVFGQVCQTLAYAHSRGIIHRDLKPLNVMVGAFGEVQVMDWGMARRLPSSRKTAPHAEAGRATASTATPRGGDLSDTVTFHLNAADPDATVTGPPGESEPTVTDPPEDRMTRGGDVMGTLAYMPPEQACGQVDLLDERSDVFGLGAILCIILTGEPPYRRRENAPLLAQAQLGSLDDALARLDTCGADPEVIALARRCLAPKCEDRPADAGVVSQEVTGYLIAVQQRLEAARIETAAATARSEVEARRRRLAQLMTKVIVLSVLGVAFAGSWYVQNRAAAKATQDTQRRHVEGQAARSLDEAEADLLKLHDKLIDPAGYRSIVNEPGSWKRFLDAADARVKEAKSVVATGGVEVDPELHKRMNLLTEVIDGSEKQRVFAAETELIRFSATSAIGVPGGGLHRIRMDAAGRFHQTLKRFGFDVARPDVAEKIHRSPLKRALIDAVDFWAVVEPDPDRVSRLLEIVRTLDPDPWRDRVRDPAYRTDPDQLTELAAAGSLPGQPPGIVQVLALLMKQAGVDPVRMLHRAISASPQDFALHYMLAALSSDRQEAIGACRAALAIRPDAAPLHNNLGGLLVKEGHAEAGIAEFREAMRLQGRQVANNHVAWNNLGFTLLGLRQHEAADYHLRESLKLKPDFAIARYNLGVVLEARGRLPEALAEYREAVRLDPNYANAKRELARLMRSTGSASTNPPSDVAEAEIPVADSPKVDEPDTKTH